MDGDVMVLCVVWLICFCGAVAATGDAIDAVGTAAIAAVNATGLNVGSSIFCCFSFTAFGLSFSSSSSPNQLDTVFHVSPTTLVIAANLLATQSNAFWD